MPLPIDESSKEQLFMDSFNIAGILVSQAQIAVMGDDGMLTPTDVLTVLMCAYARYAALSGNGTGEEFWDNAGPGMRLMFVSMFDAQRALMKQQEETRH